MLGLPFGRRSRGGDLHEWLFGRFLLLGRWNLLLAGGPNVQGFRKLPERVFVCLLGAWSWKTDARSGEILGEERERERERERDWIG